MLFDYGSHGQLASHSYPFPGAIADLALNPLMLPSNVGLTLCGPPHRSSKQSVVASP